MSCGFLVLVSDLRPYALQKWSKGKVREKLNNMVCFDQATYDRMMKEVATFKLVTPSAISERLKVNPLPPF